MQWNYIISLRWYLCTVSVFRISSTPPVISCFSPCSPLCILQFWHMLLDGFFSAQQRALLPLVSKSGGGMWGSSTVMSFSSKAELHWRRHPEVTVLRAVGDSSHVSPPRCEISQLSPIPEFGLSHVRSYWRWTTSRQCHSARDFVSSVQHGSVC